MRSLDNQSDESETSSVCSERSERSFDSFKRPSDVSILDKLNLLYVVAWSETLCFFCMAWRFHKPFPSHWISYIYEINVFNIFMIGRKCEVCLVILFILSIAKNYYFFICLWFYFLFSFSCSIFVQIHIFRNILQLWPILSCLAFAVLQLHWLFCKHEFWLSIEMPHCATIALIWPHTLRYNK